MGQFQGNLFLRSPAGLRTQSGWGSAEEVEAAAVAVRREGGAAAAAAVAAEEEDGGTTTSGSAGATSKPIVVTGNAGMCRKQVRTLTKIRRARRCVFHGVAAAASPTPRALEVVRTAPR